jgi:hypothetical protein
MSRPLWQTGRNVSSLSRRRQARHGQRRESGRSRHAGGCAAELRLEHSEYALRAIGRPRCHHPPVRSLSRQRRSHAGFSQRLARALLAARSRCPWRPLAVGCRERSARSELTTRPHVDSLQLSVSDRWSPSPLSASRRPDVRCSAIPNTCKQPHPAMYAGTQHTDSDHGSISSLGEVRWTFPC